MPDSDNHPPKSSATDGTATGGPREWRPWVRGLGWARGWVVVSASAAVVWEFAVTGTLRGGSIVIRSVSLLLAITLLIVAIVLLETWSQLYRHAHSNYNRSMAGKVFAIESLVMVGVLSLYFWFAVRALQSSWLYMHGWRALSEIDKMGSPSFLSPWLVWGVLLPACAFMLRGLPAVWRKAALRYRNAVRFLGFKRTMGGTLMMTLLRLRLPRRDFFLQSPVISWLPFLAFCVLLHVSIGQPELSWTMPVVLLCYMIPYWSDMLVPPLWLFLGKSDFDSFAAFETIRRRWNKHGLTLLDRSGEQGSAFYFAWRRAIGGGWAPYDPLTPRVWSLRTRPYFWQQTVLMLMDFVPVVVVDVRGESDIVREEITWLSEPQRIRKAWYLVAQDEQGGAALEPKCTVLPDRSRITTEQMLLAAEWSPTGLRVEPTVDA